jgi:hypothetical protein
MGFELVLPFLINFGVNKALGMSTGKALGLAGVQAFAGPMGTAASAEGAAANAATAGATQGGIGGLLSGALQQGTFAGLDSKALLLEGGKTLLAQQADKRYGINPALAYAGLQGVQGGLGAMGQGGQFFEGAKGAFTNPMTGKPLITPAAEVATKAGEGSSIFGLGKEKGITGLGTGADLGLGFAATSLLGSMGKKEQTKKPEEKPNYNYPTVKDIVTNFSVKDPVTGQTSRLVIGETPEERFQKTGYVTRYKEGGIAQFNTGNLVNMLPSKTASDEKDPNSYKRASNFVIDETGNGSEDEDTMLAQLADGEFVTTAKAVLGAGIFAGGNPSDKKSMRDKGAKFFYEQQARFKRVYEMLEKAQMKEQAA